MKFKSLVTFAAVAVMCASLTGCGTSQADIIKKTSSNLKDAESMNVDILMTADDASMDMTFTVNKDGKENLTKATGKASSSGGTVDVITYIQRNKDITTCYSVNEDTGKWEKFEQSADLMGSLSLSDFLDEHKKDISLDEGKHSVNEVDCYALNGKISKDEMEKIFGGILDGVELPETEYTIFVETDKCHVNKVVFNNIESGSDKEFEMTIAFRSWDEAEEIVIPEKAQATQKVVNNSPFKIMGNNN